MLDLNHFIIYLDLDSNIFLILKERKRIFSLLVTQTPQTRSQLEVMCSILSYIAKTGTQVIVPRLKKRVQDRVRLFPRKCVFNGMRSQELRIASHAVARVKSRSNVSVRERESN